MATTELDMAIARRLGQMIASERETKGWTQLELAGRADVSPSAVSLIEAGTRIPLFHNFCKIAHALGWEKRKISEFVDLAWRPLPYGRIGMRLELIAPEAYNSEDSSFCNVFRKAAA
jgi:transcriptional regulator with XRE-family HTH domain